jgi:hypothetical protein
MAKMVPLSACLLAACSGNSPDKSADNNASLQVQINSLSERVGQLENDLRRQQTPADTPNVSPNTKRAASLRGANATGQPIQLDFATLEDCESARKSILDEGLRSCAARDVQPSTSAASDDQCAKPQIACFENVPAAGVP